MSSRHLNRPAASVACSSKRPAALVARCSSRRRRKIADAAAAATRDSSSWASLHEDLVSLIGCRVLAGDLRDYIRFRAVCPHWRSSTTCPRGRGIVDPRFHPRRWMLFPRATPPPGPRQTRDHCILDSVDGILLLQRDQDTAIRLLHPFTGDIAEFPPLETSCHINIGAACISVGADGAVKVMMSLPGMQNFSFATSGDQHWRISSWWRDTRSVPLQFQGKFYMLHIPEVNSEPQVLQVDPPQQEDMNLGSPSLPPPKLIAKCPGSTEIYPPLLADLMLERTVPLTCIDGSTIFLSRNRSLHVSSEAFPTIVADTIVAFHTVENYLAQYHLNSGTLSAASDGCRSGIAILSPCSIIYHIFTCCFREYWNKGQIIRHGDLKRWRVKRKWRQGILVLGDFLFELLLEDTKSYSYVEANLHKGVNGSCTLVDWWWCLLFLLLQLYFYNMGFLIIGICFYPCART
ncbi:hypothetical protein GQ55_9G096200 [Panicum hallii var. hallii]|uniref:KIB1-4 beta-propeller domain-containing protein n=1 Tax=Panicum hallii var. hallii TaxID=1504633 RepID=A0A2T7C1D2_9POAL|nr:hypothetical protein GQ55_9G096200 [Panicum hallii var. hallii]